MVQLNNILSWSCLISLATLASGIPIPGKQEASIVKIPLYKKFNHLARRDAHYESLSSDKSEFYADIEVGTPPQNFSVVLDTGSDKFWVQGVECPADYCPFTRYDHSKSSTSKDANLKLEIGYLDGSGATGEFYYDTVSMAGLTLEHQLVGSSEQNGSLGIGNGVKGAHPQGLMGLSFAFAINSESNDTYPPFIFQLYEQKVIKDPIFSFYYGDITKDGYDTGAEIAIGGADTEKYTGDVEYLPVVPGEDGKYGYWQSYAQGLKITTDSDSINVWEAETDLIPAVMDSGTTNILIPTKIQEQIYLGLTGLDKPLIISDAAKNESAWQVDCSFVNSTDYKFEVVLSHSKSKTEIDDSPLTLSIPASVFVSEVLENTCIWNIPPNEDNEFLFGQRFLNYFYTVHNMETKEIGFATAIDKESQVY